MTLKNLYIRYAINPDYEKHIIRITGIKYFYNSRISLSICYINPLYYISQECTDHLYIPDNELSIDVVNIVEKYGGGCPRDPRTQPRLFNVSVDKNAK